MLAGGVEGEDETTDQTVLNPQPRSEKPHIKRAGVSVAAI
jgi:hypothetical protein